ncbi:predicted protein [Lichtheimia corymbifera JMRC:FSU:9682]|uniref:Uncharacterized protein n=1 Tax=Lichtheimia corymbifera JMRC:FSU:9682 TaxID=1263082 RepID=A0A068SHZ7_9FUNG|nr:predicted protein [Lichtheimia corymbifera JMRC:FSU:9682]
MTTLFGCRHSTTRTRAIYDDSSFHSNTKDCCSLVYTRFNGGVACIHSQAVHNKKLYAASFGLNMLDDGTSGSNKTWMNAIWLAQGSSMI